MAVPLNGLLLSDLAIIPIESIIRVCLSAEREFLPMFCGQELVREFFRSASEYMAEESEKL
jgi:hypothetical protein